MTTLKTNKTLDLVHPCYNPHLGWAEDLIRHYTLFMSRIPSNVEVHVYLVDDGSKYGVNERDISALQQAIPYFTFIPLSQNLGKGGALRHAIRQCHGDLVIYTDADYPYRMENAWEMYRRLDQGQADVVVGVRDEQYYDQLPFRRKIFSLSLKLMNYLFFPSLKVKDTQSGLKGFNAKGKALFLKTNIAAFLFDMEFLVLVSKQKDIQMEWIYVQVREGIHFSTMKPKTILTELYNFITILIRGILSK